MKIDHGPSGSVGSDTLMDAETEHLVHGALAMLEHPESFESVNVGIEAIQQQTESTVYAWLHSQCEIHEPSGLPQAYIDMLTEDEYAVLMGWASSHRRDW